MKSIAGALLLLLTAGASPAAAWGCDGHQAVAMLAERLLSPATVAAMKQVLASAPVDPRIRAFCDGVPGDPIAESATWADDFRSLDPATGNWHFINIPLIRGGDVGNYEQYCPNGQCVVDAIATQFEILQTSADPLLKANALRFLIHFIGDLHQPLHTSTNGDRGGNCLAITHYDQTPQEDQFHTFRPNLHSVWDDGTIRRLMTDKQLADARALADYALRSGRLRSAKAQTPTAAVVAAWVKEANAVARKSVYERLPVRVPLEPANAAVLTSCDANNHVSTRMAALHETIDARYERDSVPVILRQLRLAAERLAAVMKAAFPGA